MYKYIYTYIDMYIYSYVHNEEQERLQQLRKATTYHVLGVGRGRMGEGEGCEGVARTHKFQQNCYAVIRAFVQVYVV